MQLHIYALYDTVTEEYGNLLLAKTEGHIKRILIDSFKKPEDAQDYELWCLGTFDTEKGSLRALERQKRVHLAIPSDIESKSKDDFWDDSHLSGGIKDTERDWDEHKKKKEAVNG